MSKVSAFVVALCRGKGRRSPEYHGVSTWNVGESSPRHREASLEALRIAKHPRLPRTKCGPGECTCHLVASSRLSAGAESGDTRSRAPSRRPPPAQREVWARGTAHLRRVRARSLALACDPQTLSYSYSTLPLTMVSRGSESAPFFRP